MSDFRSNRLRQTPWSSTSIRCPMVMSSANSTTGAPPAVRLALTSASSSACRTNRFAYARVMSGRTRVSARVDSAGSTPWSCSAARSAVADSREAARCGSTIDRKAFSAARVRKPPACSVRSGSGLGRLRKSRVVRVTSSASNACARPSAEAGALTVTWLGLAGSWTSRSTARPRCRSSCGWWPSRLIEAWKSNSGASIGSSTSTPSVIGARYAAASARLSSLGSSPTPRSSPASVASATMSAPAGGPSGCSRAMLR